MNSQRRISGSLLIALLLECNDSGTISDENHLVATDALKSMQQDERWQLNSQEKHAGKNDSTDKQIAICNVALPALTEAIAAWNNDDFVKVIEKVKLAITTDGTVSKRTRRKK
jgi:hypothetical protein